MNGCGLPSGRGARLGDEPRHPLPECGPMRGDDKADKLVRDEGLVYLGVGERHGLVDVQRSLSIFESRAGVQSGSGADAARAAQGQVPPTSGGNCA